MVDHITDWVAHLAVLRGVAMPVDPGGEEGMAAHSQGLVGGDQVALVTEAYHHIRPHAAPSLVLSTALRHAV